MLMLVGRDKVVLAVRLEEEDTTRSTRFVPKFFSNECIFTPPVRGCVAGGRLQIVRAPSAVRQVFLPPPPGCYPPYGALPSSSVLFWSVPFSDEGGGQARDPPSRRYPSGATRGVRIVTPLSKGPRGSPGNPSVVSQAPRTRCRCHNCFANAGATNQNWFGPNPHTPRHTPVLSSSPP